MINAAGVMRDTRDTIYEHFTRMVVNHRGTLYLSTNQWDKDFYATNMVTFHFGISRCPGLLLKLTFGWPDNVKSLFLVLLASGCP